MEELDFRYIYFKQAKSLKRELINTYNTRHYSSCNQFVQRYSELKTQIETNILNKLNNSFKEQLKIISAFSLPHVIQVDYRQLWEDDLCVDKLNELIMATSQMISLLEGLGGSFKKEVDILKKENINLKNELEKVKPLFPPEVIGKVPSKLHKTISESTISYKNGQWTATGFYLRKIIENAIQIKCKREKCEDILKDKKTNEFYELPKKIDVCAGRGIIRSNRARDLKKIKLYGDSAAHSLNIELTAQDIEEAKVPARLLLEELFG